MFKKPGILSVAVIIVAIGLGFVAQSTEAGKNVLTQLQTSDLSFVNTISGPPIEAIEDDAAVSPAMVREKTFERLRAAAAASKNGMTRAIVGLDAEFTPVGYLGDRQVESQSVGIRKAQTDLIARLTSGRVKVVYEYEFMPFLLVDADETGLNQLQNDGAVLSIEEDTLAVSHLAESSPVVSAPAS